MPTAVAHHRESDSESDSGSEGAGAQSHEGYAQFSRDDSPDSVQELAPGEFPSYFIERNERLFHSSSTSPYPLPVDAREQEVRVFLSFYRFLGHIFFPEIECPECLSQGYDWRQLQCRWPCAPDTGPGTRQPKACS